MIADQTESPRLLFIGDGTTARNYSQWLEACEVEIVSSLPLPLQPPPSLVIIDVEASGIDGFQACASLKARGAVCPVLCLTPADSQAVEQAYQTGADDVLTQPILPAILKQHVAHWLEHTALREAEERHRKLLESYSDIVFALAPDMTVTYLSPTFEQLTGFANDDWIGHPFSPLIYFDDLPLALEMFQRVLKGETLPPFELRFYSNRGTIGYGEVLMQPQWCNGEQTGIWGAVRDITKRRRAEEAERQHRLLGEALRDTAAALNATLDRDEVLERILKHVSRVVPCDSANVMIIEDGVARVVRARGYTERGIEEGVYALRFDIEKTMNMKWMAETGKPYVLPDIDLFPGWDRQPVIAWIRSHVAAPIRFEGKVIGFLNLDSEMVNAFSEADAERLQAFADQAAIAIRNAELYNALRQQADELEQRVAERTYQLEHERAQLFAILDSLSEGVLYDEMLEVRYINRALTELTGYTIEEWNGYLEMLRSEKMSEQEMKRIIATLFHTVDQHQLWANEMPLRRKDGTEFDAAITCKHVLGSDGKTVGAVTVIRDISHEKALQTQKARFVAYASHELRTPITNLMTRLYLMRRQPGRLEEHLDILEAVANRMRFLVEDLLDASRFERGAISLERQIIPLQNLVSEVVNLQKPEAMHKHIHLAYSMPDAPLLVFVDPQRIVQVLTNLLTNAINYTPQDGTIQVVVSTYCESNNVTLAEIAVTDNGIGISEEHLSLIFQPFFRVDSTIDGTGLGLSITKQIVQLHGGEIIVESELGRGSTFRVRLPLYTRTATAPTEPDKDNAVQST